MKKNSTWQFFFMLGLVALIILTYIKFGSKNFLPLISLGSLIFLVVNSLLPQNRDDNEENKLLVIIQRAFNVSTYLKTGTIIVWLAIPLILLIKSPVEKKVHVVDPLRITYFDLQGLAVEFLLDGKITAEWESKLSGNPYIIQNEITRTLNRFRRAYGYELDFAELDSMQGPSLFVQGRQYSSRTKLRVLPRDFFQYDEQFVPAAYAGLETGDVLKYFGHKLTARQRAFVENYQEGGEYDETITKELRAVSLSGSDMVKLLPLDQGNNGKTVAMLSEIVSQHMPENFVTGTVTVVECGTGPLEISFYVPRLRIKVIVIENTSVEPVELGNFIIKEYGNNQLRDSLENAALGQQASSRLDKLFPLKILAPGEKIVIPTELVFTSGAELNDGSYNWEDFNYGKSMDIREIEVNNKAMAIRSSNPGSLVMIDGSYGGSCPFAFTWSDEQDRWTIESHILYGKNSTRKTGYDTIRLKNPGNEILIRELDPEISYIDFLSILWKRKDGSVTEYTSGNMLTNKKDGKSLVLQQGNSIKIKFGPVGWNKEDDSDVYLISYGYYKPLKKSGKIRNTQKTIN